MEHPMLEITPTAKLRVMAEYETSGIWLVELDGVSLIEHEDIGLPQQLSDRFYKWIALYFGRLTDSGAAEWPLDRFNAMGRELAKELKNFVGPDIGIEYIPELPGDLAGPPEPIN